MRDIQLGDASRILEALGFETLEQVIAASEVAATEFSAVLGRSIGDVLAPVRGRAAALSAEKRQQFEALSCRLGARMEEHALRSSIPVALATVAPAPAATATVSLIPQMPPIRNQGERPTCVAFASLATYEQYLHAHGADHDLSPQFLYWDCKTQDGYPNEEGTWIRVAFPLLCRDGCCLESDWPYVSNPIPGSEGQGPPPSGAQRKALAYRMPGNVPLPPTSVQDIKNILNSQRCVTFSVPVYNSWYNSLEVRRTGDITNPIPGEVAVGGHAMCIVGFVDLPDKPALGGGRFILRNSWGTAWGAESSYAPGYGSIPYLYIARHCMEAYTVR